MTAIERLIEILERDNPMTSVVILRLAKEFQAGEQKQQYSYDAEDWAKYRLQGQKQSGCGLPQVCPQLGYQPCPHTTQDTKMRELEQIIKELQDISNQCKMFGYNFKICASIAVDGVEAILSKHTAVKNEGEV